MVLCYTCGPNEALIKSGACLSKPKIIPGGYVFAIPFLQQVDRLDLNVITLEVISAANY